MEIHHLKQLITISQCGSINSASQKLYISQPSLNNIVKRCEQELGFTVFMRTPKGVKLTENGKKFVEIAQNIIAEYKKIEALSSSDKMVSISFIYLSYILEALLEFQEQGLLLSNLLRRTEPLETISDVICQKVRIGILPIYQLDLNGFIEKIKQYNLQYLMLFEAVQIYAVVSKTHPLANKKSISISETLKYPLTYYTAVPKKSVLSNIYDSKFSLKVQNRDELFLVLKNNKYFSLLTLTSNSKNPEFCYIPIIDNEFKMNVCAVFLSDTTLTKQEIKLIEFLKNTIHFI
ncbi:LysR family transcriptional regulator [[Clostridium] hylemonae]|uniref:Transcriptional regulator, LysR family n=1 Tax=[Clostridium] hylemonae DSM 15053 TaxID=553973 RepID=C0BZM4_9FIRM|nr:LysR family transcriptional regulator [[Clostridium] hylemonae]EEG74602.1 transcriptional regulator, LysR family [[Clostridium] hylemonae DSM 15053]QEK18626.1 Hca operon transcriptional activator HcaR [[Clostridium] hylemonae DSM 15053]